MQYGGIIGRQLVDEQVIPGRIKRRNNLTLPGLRIPEEVQYIRNTRHLCLPMGKILFVLSSFF